MFYFDKTVNNIYRDILDSVHASSYLIGFLWLKKQEHTDQYLLHDLSYIILHDQRTVLY